MVERVKDSHLVVLVDLLVKINQMFHKFNELLAEFTHRHMKELTCSLRKDIWFLCLPIGGIFNLEVCQFHNLSPPQASGEHK